jgi:hypothetical protein
VIAKTERIVIKNCILNRYSKAKSSIIIFKILRIIIRGSPGYYYEASVITLGGSN